jgi:hypothetical protein
MLLPLLVKRSLKYTVMLVTREITIYYAAGRKIGGFICCRWKEHCNMMLATREIAVWRRLEDC